jgi:UPF0716 family protein affecting phage T7 exclusion
MFFIPLPFVILEFFTFTTFLHFYDFWDVFLAYLAPSFLGLVLFSTLGRNLMLALQRGLQSGQPPNNQLLHKGAMLVGSILLIVPLFYTRVAAIFLLLPGLRHLSVYTMKGFFLRKLATKGSFSFGGFQPRRGFSEEPRTERDAEVVNVTPIEITHTKIIDFPEKK